jgi:ribosome-binding factor A
MPAPTRKNRLESLLHQEIATTVQQELRDPRLGFLTITRVEMTDDLHEVTAFFTVLGDTKQRRLAGQALDAAASFVQRKYAPVVRTRLLPRLKFAYDDREEKRTSMEDLIRKARSSDPNQDATPPTAPPEP